MARKTKKKLRVWPLILLLIFVAAAAVVSYHYYTDDKKVVPVKPVEEREKTTTPEDKGEANFKDASLVLQAEVDKILKSYKTENVLKDEKQIKREQGGNISWWQRQQLVYLDKKTTMDKFKQQLVNVVKAKKGTVFKHEKDRYSGKQVERIDIAYVDTLGGEGLTLIVDRLYVIPAVPVPVAKKGKLALIVDDCGYDTDTVSRMTSLDQDITFAIIPHRQFSVEALQIITHSGKEAMLHLPMEPLDASQQSEKTTITVSMSDKEIKDFTKRSIEQLPGIVGVNNHQGSRATADERVMKAVLSVVKSKNLFFVDSNTQPKTIAHKVASQMGVRTALNQAFLDGQADVDYIKGRLRQAGQSAVKNGSHIAICHARPKTVTALREMVGELEAMGVEFVFVSRLLH